MRHPIEVADLYLLLDDVQGVRNNRIGIELGIYYVGDDDSRTIKCYGVGIDTFHSTVWPAMRGDMLLTAEFRGGSTICGVFTLSQYLVERENRIILEFKQHPNKIVKTD